MYINTGHFEKGVAEGAVDPSFNPVLALRLSVVKDSAVWAILSEVSHWLMLRLVTLPTLLCIVCHVMRDDVLLPPIDTYKEDCWLKPLDQTHKVIGPCDKNLPDG